MFEFENINQSGEASQDTKMTEDKEKKDSNSNDTKLNFLHVPASYNPQVFQWNDDIIVQYESQKEDKLLMPDNKLARKLSMTEAEKPSNILNCDEITRFKNWDDIGKAS